MTEPAHVEVKENLVGGTSPPRAEESEDVGLSVSGDFSAVTIPTEAPAEDVVAAPDWTLDPVCGGVYAFRADGVDYQCSYDPETGQCRLVDVEHAGTDFFADPVWQVFYERKGENTYTVYGAADVEFGFVGVEGGYGLYRPRLDRVGVKGELPGYPVTRNQLVAMIKGEILAGNGSGALGLLTAWNDKNPTGGIGWEDFDAGETDRLVKAVLADRRGPAEEPPAKRTKVADDFVIGGKTVSAVRADVEGGFHEIHRIDEKWLIRKPMKNARLAVAGGLKEYRKLAGMGIPLPELGNATTAEKDGFYVVEDVPLAFSEFVGPPGPPRGWSDQVGKAYRQIAEWFQGNLSAAEEVIPDLRPDNLRFRKNGDLVLVDFSRDAEFDDFARRAGGLARELAGESAPRAGDYDRETYEFLVPERYREQLAEIKVEDEDYLQ